MVTKRNATAVRRGRPARTRSTGLICVAAAAGALLVGCGNDDGDNTQTDTSTAGRAASPSSSPSSDGGGLTDDQRERKELVPKAKVGYDKALDAAIATVDKAKPVSIELKGTPDKPVWKAEVATADGATHDVDVDAVTGKAGQARADNDQDQDDKRELADWLKKATVTAQQAAQTATDKKKGTVTSVELDDSDKGDTVLWSVDVVTTDDWNKTTYDIDAANRKIVREHVDRD
ncbi:MULTISPECIES: PepSY domain-containing protein [Streptomyces]|uniref:Peptidase M4 n=2 Tax=Streptomyces TaxID=1883 RepID=A0A5P2B484_STRVZ|nr:MULTISPECIES: PepSY domain-containing protein [Streptomyces]NEA00761.1 PepSY domain-containing protein [Streptomyces sp. SID10116]MYY86932.1 peptidase M4 [Streptomyces sp. SID335]NDZ88622.1 PepSY domain-containing protein [Streptomyces sp. SID10115]NEB49908.1 PepSY domain-containing protein [Streptomyces sp. SID339]QES25234.1 peptidase M4 [Streptomyces venezuelae]